MSLSAKKILGVNVTASSNDDILEEVQKYLLQVPNSQFQIPKKKIKPFIIFTPNPEIITYAQKNNDFKQIVNTAQINLPDGAGVVWAMKKLYGMKIRQIAGVDFMSELVKMAVKESLRIGLIGGRGGVALATLECLRKKHPKLSGWAMDGPEIEIKNEKLKIKNYENKRTIKTLKGSGNGYFNTLINEIITKKTAILFVALGFPKQEYFINRIAYHVSRIKYDKPLVLMAVGGAFDYISGRIPRAPLFIRNLELEWLFRLIQEPWRLPRQLKGAAFFYRLLTHRV